MERPQADLVVRGRSSPSTRGSRGPVPSPCAAARIVAVGPDDAAVEDLVGDETEVVDATGGLVLPGFIDSHNHIRLGTPDALDLSNAGTLEDVHAMLRTHVAADPSIEWIEAGRCTTPRYPARGCRRRTTSPTT